MEIYAAFEGIVCRIVEPVRLVRRCLYEWIFGNYGVTCYSIEFKSGSRLKRTAQKTCGMDCALVVKELRNISALLKVRSAVK